MQQSRRRIVVGWALLALGCGFDARDFGGAAGHGVAGIAGFAYDAGSPEGGRTVSSPPARGPSSDWERAPADGGEGGEPEDPAVRSPRRPEGGAAGVGGEPADDGGAGERGEGGRDLAGRGGNGAGGAGAGLGGASAGHGSATGGRSGAGRGGIGGTGGHTGIGGAGGHAGLGAAGGTGGATGAHGGGGGSGGQGERALWFSEYVEGSGKNKALELRAAAATSLEGCRVSVYFNGKTDASGPALSGELAAGDAYVLCSSTLATLLGATCNRTMSLTFNGNDAVVLECDGKVVDVIGQIGFDPETAWTAEGVSTVDQTLRRRCSVTHGDSVATDAFDPSVEWASHLTDDFSGLGVADCD